MGFLDALFGREDEQQDQYRASRGRTDVRTAERPSNADEQAVARYRYMLQTALPEELEQAHTEAFARLTPEQRRLALRQLAQVIPESEARQLSDDPRSLARATTRGEIRQPGFTERIFGGANAIGRPQPNYGVGFGGSGVGLGSPAGVIAGSLISSLAGAFIGSSIANAFFSNPEHEHAFHQSPEAAAVDGGINDFNTGDIVPAGLDASADPYGDPADFQSAGLDASADPYGDPDDTGGFDSFDTGGDFGDFGSDL